MYRRARQVRVFGLAAAVVAFAGCAPTTAVRSRSTAQPAAVGAGFRCSTYGRAGDAGPAYWERVGREMSARLPGTTPEAVWIVARLYGEGTRVSFPVVAGTHPLIQGETADTSEEALDRLDAAAATGCGCRSSPAWRRWSR